MPVIFPTFADTLEELQTARRVLSAEYDATNEQIDHLKAQLSTVTRQILVVDQALNAINQLKST